MLRPMANVFAATGRDPAELDELVRRLSAEPTFTHVWRPAPGWVAAQAPLPESDDDEAARQQGFAFIQGRDRLERENGLDWLHRLAETADGAPDRLGAFPGDFDFIRFRADGDALAVRSCAGVAPIYVHRRPGGGLAIGTRLAHFPRLLDERFAPDPLMNAAFQRSLQFIDERTFVEGVKILPPGTYTKLAAGREPHTQAYWDPRPQAGATIEPDPEHAARLRHLLLETLERDLDRQGRNLITVSGGVDSCSIAALAGGTLDRRIASWSLIPPHEPARSRELSYIDPLVQEFGIKPALRSELTLDLLERWLADAPALPFQVANPGLCQLAQIRRENEVRVLVGGEFADQVCGHWHRITDWVRNTSLATLLGHPRKLPFGPRDYVRWVRRKGLDLIQRPMLPSVEQLPAWAPPAVHAEYRQWRSERRAAVAADRRPLKELAEEARTDAWVAMNWEGAGSQGVRRSYPFFNREILELAFSCHPSELLGPGTKRLLREAIGKDVPARYMSRSDKGQWGRRAGDVDAKRTGSPPALGPLPSTASRFVRADWLPEPPSDAHPYDILSLRLALRAAAWLDAPQAIDA
jgi:asparagine synthetase B (glutamine-hydrolysing)